jgi:tetratricopeptide (TPR) repeat protein
MKKRLVIGSALGLLLVAMAAFAALYLGSRRDVTTASDEASRLFKEAVENERRFYFREAREGFAKALELDPQFAEAMLGLARMTEGDQGLALVLRAAKERDRLTERERLHVDLQLALRQGKLDDALKVAQKIHESHPDDIRAAMYLAHHEIQAGNTERAVQIFSDVLAVEPNNADAYNQIGYFYAYRGDYDKAIENLRKYQFMAPDQANPYDSLGEIQAYSGHYDEAIQNLNHALKLKPDFYESYRHLGVAFEGKGDYARAIASYRKAAQEALNDEMRRELLRNALRAAFTAGDAAAAREIVAQYRSLTGDTHPEVSRLGLDAVLDIMEGRPAQAESRLKEVLPKLREAYAKGPESEKPADAKSFYDAGWTYLMAQALIRQGRGNEALTYCQQLADPPQKWVNFDGRRWVYAGRAMLAELLARNGDLDRAEKLLAENRKWNPSWAPTRSSEQAVAQLRREKVLAASK